MQAYKMAQDNELISTGIMIGDKELIEKSAIEKGVDLKKFELVHETDVAQMCTIAVRYVRQGEADILFKGMVDTSLYMKAVLNKTEGLAKPGAVLSAVILFETPKYHKIFAMTDYAIMIKPTLDEKRQIIQNAADIMNIMGKEKPKVSVICPVEKVNPKIPSTLDAQELSLMSKDGRIKNAIVEGPYDVYITFSRELADEKGVKGGQVPGDADIVLLPDLDSANPVYKSITFFGEKVRTATIIAGTTAPVILPSRTDPPITKMLSLALCSFLKLNLVK
jgi:phosphate butyryltransferase